MSKKVYVYLALVIGSGGPAYAQSSDITSQPPRTEVKSDTTTTASALSDSTTDSYRPARQLDSIRERSIGLDLNIARILALGSIPARTFSGGISFFDNENASEIAIPVYYGEIDYNQGGPTIYSSLDVDVHYRKYFGESAKGFYFSGFVRSTYQTGYESIRENYLYDPNKGFQGYQVEYLGMHDQFKMGIGVGLGYRLFSRNGMYWGASLGLGRYLVGKSNVFSYGGELFADDVPFIIDVEFLKFGYAF